MRSETQAHGCATFPNTTGQKNNVFNAITVVTVERRVSVSVGVKCISHYSLLSGWYCFTNYGFEIKRTFAVMLGLGVH